MTEDQFRSAIAAEAGTWANTPYHNSGALKGVGVNCAQFLYCVAKNAGVLPAGAPDPRKFTGQVAAVDKEERLAAYIAAYGGREITEAEVKTGDIVFYRVAGQHGHTAIVLQWPNVMHSMPLRGCQMGLVNEGQLGSKHRRYFTLWKSN
jgi:cell wall-associated NlpC family hydrolase